MSGFYVFTEQVLGYFFKCFFFLNEDLDLEMSGSVVSDYLFLQQRSLSALLYLDVLFWFLLKSGCRSDLTARRSLSHLHLQRDPFSCRPPLRFLPLLTFMSCRLSDLTSLSLIKTKPSPSEGRVDWNTVLLLCIYHKQSLVLDSEIHLQFIYEVLCNWKGTDMASETSLS